MRKAIILKAKRLDLEVQASNPGDGATRYTICCNRTHYVLCGAKSARLFLWGYEAAREEKNPMEDEVC